MFGIQLLLIACKKAGINHILNLADKDIKMVTITVFHIVKMLDRGIENIKRHSN